MTQRPWTFIRSTDVYAHGKLTLREDVWRLPSGREEVYPVLAVGLTVGVVPSWTGITSCSSSSTGPDPEHAWPLACASASAGALLTV